MIYPQNTYKAELPRTIVMGRKGDILPVMYDNLHVECGDSIDLLKMN